MIFLIIISRLYSSSKIHVIHYLHLIHNLSTLITRNWRFFAMTEIWNTSSTGNDWKKAERDWGAVRYVKANDLKTVSRILCSPLNFPFNSTLFNEFEKKLDFTLSQYCSASNKNKQPNLMNEKSQCVVKTVTQIAYSLVCKNQLENC